MCRRHGALLNLAKELSMSPLRRRMIEDMQIRNLAAHTQRVYVEQLIRFARYFRKSPEHLGPATNFHLMVAVVGAVAVSGGILSPILTFWISTTAGQSQGKQLGRQTTANSLGTTVGSVAGGLLFNVAFLPDAAVALTVVMIAIAFVISLRLPNQLVPRRLITP